MYDARENRGTPALTTRETWAIRMEGRMGLHVTSSNDKTIWGAGGQENNGCKWPEEQWSVVNKG